MPSLKRARQPIAALQARWTSPIEDYVIALQWSPRGRIVAAAASSGPITLFNGDTGTAHAQLPGHSMGTAALAWQPGGTLLASAGHDGKIRLWDAATGDERATLPAGSTWAECVAWSPAGDLLATAAGKKLRLWDAAGTLVREYPDHPSTITDVQWKPRGRTLAASHYGGVTLWTPTKQEPVRRFEWKGSSLALAWSPTGRYLATGEQDSTVHFWNVETGQDLHMYGYETKIRELAWDSSGRWLATGGGNTIPVWDCSGKGPEGTKPIMLKGHAEPPAVLMYQHSGPLLLSGGRDGLIAVWHPVKSNKPLALAQLGQPVTQAAWSPDEQRIAASDEHGLVTMLER